jgi:hypothetical protein
MNQKDIPLITAERWIANLLEAARDLADRQKQECRWLVPDRGAWERPEEVINAFWDDCVFELFVEQHSASFSDEQRRAAHSLRDALDAFCFATPQVLDPVATLADPRWELVRQKAVEFVGAFDGKWPGA